MTSRAFATALVFFLTLVPPRFGASLNMDVTGDNKDKAPLETLSASPDLPSADSLSYSLDGGKDARDKEITPMSIADAAKLSDLSHLPAAGYPALPSAPYIMHPMPASLPHASTWTFIVADDQARVWHEEVALSSAPPRFSWDGTRDGKFVLDPNAAYISLVKVQQSDGDITTLPGQAARFPAFLRQEKGNLVVVFGERIYAESGGGFSDVAGVYLDDLVRRLSLLPPPLPNEWDDKQTWSIALFEPSGNDEIGDARVVLWKKYLEEKLGLRIPQNKVTLRDATDSHARVEVVLKGVSPLALDAVMHAPLAHYRPTQESAADWVKVHADKETLFVDLQHDNLFRSGTAYLRDEALPPLLAAMKRVRAELNAPDAAKKRPVKLRSYTEKVWDQKKTRESEDPKLTALRSKVLFTLFAKEGLLK
jgi:hypothetical protein